MRFTWKTDPLVSELYQLKAPEAPPLLAKALQTVDTVSVQEVQALCDKRLTPEVLDKQQQELLLRSRPLRELFEARGPGLLHQLALRTESSFKPESVTIWMVHPGQGGGGMVAGSAAVVMEAVLANPSATLPETVRLAWLLACGINNQTPRRLQSNEIPALALIPPLLEAAQDVELAYNEPALLVEALQLWTLATDSSEAASLAKTLLSWREETFQQAWPQAVTLLQERLR